MVERERIHPATRAEWRAWLEANHRTSRGVWLVQWRTVTGRRELSYDDIVEEALCFGWVDGRAGRIDDERSMILVTPRRASSTWARTNKERVERLESAGRMTDAGRRAVEVAKANGSWTVLDDVDALVVPDDLAAALAADDGARQHFERFPPSARKAALYWVTSAKRPETRRRRIDETVRLAAQGLRAPRSARSS